jgi:hypothetical protein
VVQKESLAIVVGDSSAGRKRVFDVEVLDTTSESVTKIAVHFYDLFLLEDML